MIEAIELVVGAGIITVGFTAGFVAGRVNRRRRASSESPQSICEGCDDGLSYHDENGACHALHERTVYDSAGNKRGKRQYRCTCQKYVGPVPADLMLASFTVPPNREPAVSLESHAEPDDTEERNP